MRRASSSQQQIESNTEQQLNAEQQTKTESTANSSASDKSNSTLKEETTTEQTSDEEVTTTITEYDTSQPTDATTGTPPLKKQTIQTRRKVDMGKQKQIAEQTTDHRQQTARQTYKEQTTNTALQAQTQQRSDTDTKVASEEKRGLNMFQQILCTIGLLVIAGVIIWLLWRLKRAL